MINLMRQDLQAFYANGGFGRWLKYLIVLAIGIYIGHTVLPPRTVTVDRVKETHTVEKPITNEYKYYSNSTQTVGVVPKPVDPATGKADAKAPDVVIDNTKPPEYHFRVMNPNGTSNDFLLKGTGTGQAKLENDQIKIVNEWMATWEATSPAPSKADVDTMVNTKGSLALGFRYEANKVFGFSAYASRTEQAVGLSWHVGNLVSPDKRKKVEETTPKATGK